jgi:type VI protein secretion system component VasF
MNWRERFGLDGRLFGPEGNPFLRLSAADRYRLAVKLLLWFIGTAVFLWVLTWLGWQRA